MTPRQIATRAGYFTVGAVFGVLVTVPATLAWLASGPKLDTYLTPTPQAASRPQEPFRLHSDTPPCTDWSVKDCMAEHPPIITNTTPEPGTLVLVGTAAALLMLRRKT